MADAPPNPPGATPGNPSQPPSGQTRGLAAKVANATGKPAAPGKTGPGSKGGRLSAQEEVSRYCQQNNLKLVPADAPGDANGAAVAPVYLVSPEFVGDFSKTLLEGVEAYRVRQVALRVKTLCGDLPLAKEYAESSAAPPGTIAGIGKGMTELAKKYPAMLQWAPEISVGGLLVAWVKKDMDNMKRLDALEQKIIALRKAEVGKEAPAAPPKPAPNPTP